ncbi:MAG: hypothetical protein P4L93_01570 [Coriobacteriia bacterium]|nr:hypothetical protein [Coriobacteriia bacterium]
MKNQYFGDRNDFFKYDLTLSLVEQVGALRAFTLLPMLTPDDGRADGNFTDYSALGKHRPGLHEYLKACVADPARRRVSSLKHYMRRNEPKVRYHQHGDDAYLTDVPRASYFAGVSQVEMASSVILLDPDNGFEVSSMSRTTEHKYLRYSELADLYHAMGRDSVLLVYQRWPRMPRDKAFADVVGKIADHLPEAPRPVCVSSASTGFFALAKDEQLLSEVRGVFDGYADSRGFEVYA